jgi:hypothetical protein
MKTRFAVLGAGTVVALAGSAQAGTTLQFDLNGLSVQVVDSGGSPTAFGGLTHTGSILLGYDSTVSLLNSIGRQTGSGPFVDQGFSGALSAVDGEIELVGGLVSGGYLTFEVDGVDTYTALIKAGSGMVQTAVTPGGFKVEATTYEGAFSDAMFSNVDVSDFFAAQGDPIRLEGAFLHFNFVTGGTGAGHGDVDAFVVVPLPSAAAAGLGSMAALAGLGVLRRRR